jgi:phytoene synthase
MPEKDVAYASFEQKWLDANPEQAAVAIFLDPARRDTMNAFGTLIYEIAHTTFGVRETQVAAAKLGWWQQELANAASGNSRHPIGRELFRVSTISVDNALWHALIDGALAQIDAPPAANFDELRARLAEFYGPVAAIESRLNGNRGNGIADLWIGSHLIAMLRSSTSDHIDLPLDVLARHGATRADLARQNPRRSAALKDFLGRVRGLIAESLNADAPGNLSRRVRARLDLRLAEGALRANDPAAYIATRYHRMRWRSAWSAWREARAAQKRRS